MDSTTTVRVVLGVIALAILFILIKRRSHKVRYLSREGATRAFPKNIYLIDNKKPMKLFEKLMPLFLAGETAGQKQVYCVFNKTEESFLGLSVTSANTSLTRLRGLLGKLNLKSGEGIWVVPSQGVHTIGVLFPVDVVYLDAENRVLDLVEHMRPFSIARLRLHCASVLELPPHTIYRSHTGVGNELLICLPEEMQIYLKNHAGAPKEFAVKDGSRQ